PLQASTSLGEIGEAVEDAEQLLVPGPSPDLHVAGTALRTERPEPRQLVAGLRSRVHGKAAERAHQVLRLALAGLPRVLAEPERTRLPSCAAVSSSNLSTSPGLARRRTMSRSQ